MTDKVKRMLADIQKLAPGVRARAAEIEAARRIPSDLVAVLKSIGIFRMFVPRSHGGLELDAPEGAQVIKALSRIDASLGWTSIIGGVGSLVLAQLPRETYDRIYEAGPDVINCGSLRPGGTAEAVPGGLRVSGRWAFASGCQHADWLTGLCIMTEGGKPIPGPAGVDGAPMMGAIVQKADEWEIEDTWHATGLKGTGSHDVLLKDKFIPVGNVADFPGGRPCVPGHLYSGMRYFMSLLHGASVVGMAMGALDDLVALANTGGQQLGAPVSMRDSETFQGELGRVAADVRAAEIYHQGQLASHWEHALVGKLEGEGFYVESAQCNVWLAATCVRVADACFMLGGSASVQTSSPLQRWLRDLHVAAQHGTSHPRHYPSFGKHLLEHTVGMPGFAVG